MGISAGIGMVVVAHMQGLGSPYLLGFAVALAMVGSCIMSGLSGRPGAADTQAPGLRSGHGFEHREGPNKLNRVLSEVLL